MTAGEPNPCSRSVSHLVETDQPESITARARRRQKCLAARQRRRDLCRCSDPEYRAWLGGEYFSVVGGGQITQCRRVSVLRWTPGRARLEVMETVPVDHRDIDGCSCRSLRRGEASDAVADNQREAAPFHDVSPSLRLPRWARGRSSCLRFLGLGRQAFRSSRCNGNRFNIKADVISL